MATPFDADLVDVVVGPVLGGIILAQWVTAALNARRTTGETLAVYAEKEDAPTGSQFSFRRGYDAHIAGKRILVVEDILTTGGSARKVIELVRQHDGMVIGLSALCNRGGVHTHDVGDVPLSTLVSLPLDTYTEEECPFCRQGVPVNTGLGKGKAFLARKAERNKQ
jgi:orotate phosphoribosyltransferase